MISASSCRRLTKSVVPRGSIRQTARRPVVAHFLGLARFLEAARVARESAEEQYNSEQRQFRAGTSTLFLVQQRQSTMIAGRSQERRAEADLAEAIGSFELATASILREHNIILK